MDSLNVNRNNTREFCNIQYKKFIAPNGGMTIQSLLLLNHTKKSIFLKNNMSKTI